MKTLTATLMTTKGVQLPAPGDEGQPFGDFAGYRLTLTAPSGNKSAAPPAHQSVWRFAPMVEGSTYKLLVEAIDTDGRTIQALPEITITVPSSSTGTYERLDAVSLAWSDYTAP